MGGQGTFWIIFFVFDFLKLLISNFKKFFRYIGHPGFQNGVGEDIGMLQTTVSLIVAAVTDPIVQKSNVWINFPSAAEALQQKKCKWQENFRSAIGAIDCTHIPIIKSAVHRDESCLNVQATCNVREEFTRFDLFWPGAGCSWLYGKVPIFRYF